jgi:hypothetical protein
MIERRSELAPFINALIAAGTAGVGIWLWNRLANISTPLRVAGTLDGIIAFAVVGFAVKIAISN